MGQSTSEILEQELFELHLCSEICRQNAQRLFFESSQAEKQARVHVRRGDLIQAESSLRQKTQKHKNAMTWQNNAERINSLKQTISVAALNAEVGKVAKRMALAIKRSISTNPYEIDRTLELFADELESYGCAGEGVMESTKEEEFDVSKDLVKLQEEIAVEHDLPFTLPAPGGRVPMSPLARYGED